MRWSCGVQGRVPRLAQRRVILFFWPIRASSCHQISIGRPAASFARISARRAGKFFQMRPRLQGPGRDGAAGRQACGNPACALPGSAPACCSRLGTPRTATAPGPPDASAPRRGSPVWPGLKAGGITVFPAVMDLRNGEKPAGLVRAFGALRQIPQPARGIVRTQCYPCAHGNLPAGSHGESEPSRFEKPLHESCRGGGTI